MRAALLGYPGLRRAAGGFFYDRHLIGGLRNLGATVDEINLRWFGFGYTRGLAANLLPLPPLGGYDLILEDQIVHPSMCLRNRRIGAGGPPVIAIVHNLTSVQPRTRRRRIARLVERAYLRTVAGVVAVCDSTRRDVELVGGAGRPVLVAYPGRDHLAAAVDEAIVSTRATEPGPLRLLFAGVVAPHKGLHRLVDALGRLPRGTVTLDVAGSLTEAPEYVRLVGSRIAAAGMSAHVRMHGELGVEPLQQLFRQSQAFALPSDREAYSLAALDALGCGLPALLPLPGGSGELISSGVEGHLIPPDDIAAWSAEIARFADDRRSLAACGRAALARHQSHTTWAQTAAQVSAFAGEIINGTTATKTRRA